MTACLFNPSLGPLFTCTLLSSVVARLRVFIPLDAAPEPTHSGHPYMLVNNKIRYCKGIRATLVE